MRIIRGRLQPFGAFVPTRWNEDDQVVQTSPDGGTTWQDNPGADRRTQVLLPPLDTANPKCDAAANLTVAIHEEIDALVAQMNFSAELLPLGSLFVQWLFRFTFPGWIIQLVYGVMSVLLDAGAEDIDTEFTTAVYDDLQCYFYQYMDDAGVLTETSVQQVADRLYAEQALTVYNVLALVFFYSMGFGGLTDAAASGSETGDCAACAYCPDLPLEDATVLANTNFLTANIPAGWTMTDQNNGSSANLYLYEDDFTKAGIAFSERCMKKIRWNQAVSGSRGSRINLYLAGVIQFTGGYNPGSGEHSITFEMPYRCDELRIAQDGGTPNGSVYYTSIELSWFELE